MLLVLKVYCERDTRVTFFTHYLKIPHCCMHPNAGQRLLARGVTAADLVAEDFAQAVKSTCEDPPKGTSVAEELAHASFNAIGKMKRGKRRQAVRMTLPHYLRRVTDGGCPEG